MKKIAAGLCIPLAAGMSSITIVTESGEELSFLKEDTEVDVADGLQEGMFVTITYKNTEEGQIATFITDAIEPQIQQGQQYR